MEEQVAQLLAATQSASEAPRKQAEQQLQSLWSHPEYAPGLVAIASHDSVPLNIRQAALLSLRQFVVSCWSSQFDEFKGQPGETLVPEDVKARVRGALLDLALSEQLDRKVKAVASYVVSKIASADFPEQWPDLLQKLMHIIPNGTEGQLHGALKVLSELVDDALNDEQFFRVAKDLVKLVYDVAASEQRKPTHRALAVSVFRGCFDILETVMEEHKTEVKAFAEEVLNQWTPFFINIMKTRLPDAPSEQEEAEDTPGAENYKGLVSLKLQVVKVSEPLLFKICICQYYLGAHADTVCLPGHTLSSKSRVVLSHMGGTLIAPNSISSDVHTGRTSEQTGRCRRTALYPRFPRSRGARLYAGLSSSTAGTIRA